DDLVVIGVSEESAEKVQGMKTPKIKYYSALDSDKRLNGIFEIKGIPHVVLIDPDGIVRWEGFPTLYNHELTLEVIASIISDYKSK
ncbi:MAG: TlpA family protein disulfide reductase, partial [Bacteroidota bacterium]